MRKSITIILSIIILNSQAQAMLGYSSYFPSMFTAFYEIVSGGHGIELSTSYEESVDESLSKGGAYAKTDSCR
ncbi:hypothetical protein [Endomicrobium proavitum]|uniref:Uncharacterized protein n=1 Tax=Endomicrobium proavitum TaxID=1408281 RepID=A0A0G3WKL0_9BACT|nr:hypothetical protein [Endomicrobium proavitum]AKL98422.1 exported protein of unknown function [Endomicrobium proavitum]